MNYRATIRAAWGMAQDYKSLIWWFGFPPAVISTVVFVFYAGYYSYLLWTSLFSTGTSGNPWNMGIEFFLRFWNAQPSLTAALVIVLAFFMVLWIMLPVFTEGALIQLLARHKQGRPISIPDGIGLGFRRFLQLFEFHLAIKTFGIASIITNTVFFSRYLGPELVLPIFAMVFVVGLFLTLLFTYSQYYIALEDTGMFSSMLSSSKLVVRHWHHTLFMLILMAFISLRILINILFALLIPVLIAGPIIFFTSITLAEVGAVVGGLVGLVALYFASYFVGVFHVFTTAVWTYTFLELSQRD